MLDGRTTISKLAPLMEHLKKTYYLNEISYQDLELAMEKTLGYTDRRTKQNIFKLLETHDLIYHSTKSVQVRKKSGLEKVNDQTGRISTYTIRGAVYCWSAYYLSDIALADKKGSLLSSFQRVLPDDRSSITESEFQKNICVRVGCTENTTLSPHELALLRLVKPVSYPQNVGREGEKER